MTISGDVKVIDEDKGEGILAGEEEGQPTMQDRLATGNFGTPEGE